jgi:phosphoglycerol transferase
MSTEYANEVKKGYTRKTYTAYINADAKRETKNMRTYSTMDNFPTTLAALGVKIDGERLGLGTNLFSSTPTLSEIYGYASISKQLKYVTKELIELEPFENTEAIQQYQYMKAKAYGHKDILTVEAVSGSKITVKISDFRPQKVVTKVYLQASTDMSMPLGIKSVQMKCLDPETLTYEGTIDVKDIAKDDVYVQVMYESPEGVQFPLNRTYVSLTDGTTSTTATDAMTTTTSTN